MVKAEHVRTPDKLQVGQRTEQCSSGAPGWSLCLMLILEARHRDHGSGDAETWACARVEEHEIVITRVTRSRLPDSVDLGASHQVSDAVLLDERQIQNSDYASTLLY